MLKKHSSRREKRNKIHQVEENENEEEKQVKRRRHIYGELTRKGKPVKLNKT